MQNSAQIYTLFLCTLSLLSQYRARFEAGLCMHGKWKDRCAQVTGGKPPQAGQGREGGRIRNFTDSASR